MIWLLFIFSGLCLPFSIFAKPDFSLSWPTPNPAFAQGLGYSTFLQKTGPDKDFSSGAYGCVRNSGHKFHEGVDLFPIEVDKQGKALDQVFAAISGTVVYFNQNPSHSAYGRYVVLEHPSLTPSIYTLYAHLASINPNINLKSKVQVAEAIGRMGNSSSFRIPLNRSHLHFEMGLRLSDDFQSWFDKKKFKTPNRHGNFSGFNLVGVDPLHFFTAYRKQSFEQPVQYLSTLPVIVKVRVHNKSVPNFALRYPSLCPNIKATSTSWDCSFGPFGIPLKIESAKMSKNSNKTIEILSYDFSEGSLPCRQLIEKSSTGYIPSEQLKTYLELIFGG